MTKRKETKEKSSAAFSALPKIAVAGEGLGNLGILEELGKLESIIGNIIIVPNVENSLSGICYIPNAKRALSGEKLGNIGILGDLEELGIL